jgi:hypothetical protein
MNSTSKWFRLIGSAVGAVLIVGCTGAIETGDDPDLGVPGIEPTHSPPPPLSEVVLPMAVRQLAPDEIAASFEYLLGEAPSREELALVPAGESLFQTIEDVGQSAKALLAAATSIGENAFDRLRLDRARRDRVVGCVPSGPADAACLDKFVRQFGRRALRRPMRNDEVKALVDAGLAEAGQNPADFYRAIELCGRTLVQDMEFVHRIEIGTPAGPGVVKLTSHEMASRLSFLLWGRPPQEPPQDAAGINLPRLADGGRLSTRDEVLTAARGMLAASWARARILRFHGQWMQYEANPETDALVDRVLFKEKSTRSWLDLFRMKESCMSQTQAQRLGLAWPAGAPTCSGAGTAWVSYGASGRQGILSHASILSASLLGREYPELSELFRGRYVQNTFFGEDVPELPEEQLKAILAMLKDKPPAAGGGGMCKRDHARATRLAAGSICAGCHTLMDPIGFGLDNYDDSAVFHAKEENGCPISGEGEVVDRSAGSLGTFNGPAGLANLLIDKQVLDRTAMTQLFRYAMGRAESADDDDRMIARLTDGFRGTNHRFEQALLDLIGSAAFNYGRLQ